MILESEIKRWERFLKALRRDDKDAFEELMNSCRNYASAAGAATRPIITEAMFTSILLAHQKNPEGDPKPPLKGSDQAFSHNSGGKVRGWILDLYPEKAGKMAAWIKTEKGRCLKVVDEWSPSFYISAPSEKDLIKLTWYLPKNDIPVEYEFVDKFAQAVHGEVTVDDALKAIQSFADSVF